MDLDKLRELCMSLPGATEGIKWEEHICFMVAEKMFCITGEENRVAFKVLPEEFDQLTDREGIVPNPYMARNMWVNVQKYSALKPAEWNHYIRQSYELIAAKLPKKVRAQLGN